MRLYCSVTAKKVVSYAKLGLTLEQNTMVFFNIMHIRFALKYYCQFSQYLFALIINKY
jgi:hypothetical protein